MPVLILVVIAVPSIRLLAHQYSPPQRRSHRQGDRQPMVLELRISRPWRDADLATSCPTRKRRARGEPRQLARRQAHGRAGRRGREGDRHLQRRHPRLGRPGLLGEDRRGPRPAQRDLVPGRSRGRLLRRLLRAVRRPPRLYADRRRGGEPRAVRRSGCSRRAAIWPRRAPPRAMRRPRASPAAAAAPPAPATAAATGPTGNVTAGTATPATTNQSATTNR